MDAFTSGAGGLMDSFLGQSASFNFSMKPLSGAEQKHMQLVFATLAGGILATGVGAYFAYYVFAVPLLLGAIGQIVSVCYVASSSPPAGETKIFNPRRLAAFGAVSFFCGCNIMPLLVYADKVDPAIIVHAFFITMGVFVCMFLSAAFSKNRSHVYLGAVLGSAASVLSLTAFLNIFFRSNMGHNMVLYGGLFVAMGYLFFFTQKTLADLEQGNRDYVLHGLHFYLELFSVFVRVLIILTNNKKESESKKRRRD